MAILTSLFWLGLLGFSAASWVLWLVPATRRPRDRTFRRVTVVVPARNEEAGLRDCLDSVLAAGFSGDKEVIVIDNASTDRTAAVALEYAPRVALIQNLIVGKGDSLNRGLAAATGDLFVALDADSRLRPDALRTVAGLAGRAGVAAASGAVAVSNRGCLLGAWAHIDWVHFSLLRRLWSKLGAGGLMAGPLCAYRTEELRRVGGFRTDTVTEGLDAGLRLAEAGWAAEFADEVLVDTRAPDRLAALARQRAGWMRGMLGVLKRFLGRGRRPARQAAVLLPILALLLATSMIPLLLWRAAVDARALSPQYLADRLTPLGLAHALLYLASGHRLDSGALLGVAGGLSVYGLLALALGKYGGRLGPLDAVALLLFFFPFWSLLSVVHLLCLPELLRPIQSNVSSKANSLT